MYHNVYLFTCWWTLFQFLTINEKSCHKHLNKSLFNTSSLILGKISRSGTDGLYGVMFNFVHNFRRCSELIPFSIPVSNVWEVQVLRTLTNIFTESSILWVCTDTSLWFWFALLLGPLMLNILSCAYWPFVELLWNGPSNNFPIKNVGYLFSCCETSLHILGAGLYYIKYFLLACDLLIFVNQCPLKSSFNFDEVNLPTFPFMFCAFCILSKTSLPIPKAVEIF